MRVLIHTLALGLLVSVGCSTGSRDDPESTTATSNSGTTAGAGSGATSPTGSGSTTPGTPSTPSPTPVTRLTLNDPGVAVGVQLLRGQLSANQAATAWQSEGISPAQAKDLLGRLPFAAAPGPGSHRSVDSITDAWGRTTDVSVVVPLTGPPAGGYPVVVFLHGLGGDSTQISGVAQAIGSEFIVVAPSALQPPPSVTFEDDAPIPLLNAFPHWWVYRDNAFATKALDWVRERYPIDTNRIVLFGVSMGGFGCWNVGLRYHDRFAGLVVGAGGISRVEYAIPPDAVTRRLLNNGRMVDSWFGHGTADNVVPASFSQTISADLSAINAQHTYREIAGGAHDTTTFQPLFPEILAWITAARRDPSPRQVMHRAIGGYHSGAYWVDINGAGSVSATASGQTIQVTTGNGATGATVYLDPNLVDLSQPVTVRVNGTTIQNGIPTPSLQAVASSFAKSRDPLLTYTHRVSTP